MSNTVQTRLKAARKEAWMTQAQLAAACGLTTSAIGNIEAGVRKAPLSMPKIAEALGVSLRWLLGEGDELETQHDLSPHARELAEMFDRIDRNDKVARALAYNSAMSAILAVIQKELTQPSTLPTDTPVQRQRTGS